MSRASPEPIISIRRAGSIPVRLAQVVGERCSGTNFLDALLFDNFKLSRGNFYGWKHGFPTFCAAPPAGLCIVVARNALDWVRSMYGKPWHSSPSLRNLGFSDFIRAPWQAVVDKGRYFSLPEADGRVGQVLQYDRHPITGQEFCNIVQLRNAKLASHLGLLNRNINIAIVRHEDLLSQPGHVLETIAEAFDINKRESFLTIPSGKFGWNWEHRSKTIEFVPKSLSESDREFVISALDLSQERLLGYQYK